MRDFVLIAALFAAEFGFGVLLGGPWQLGAFGGEVGLLALIALKVGDEWNDGPARDLHLTAWAVLFGAVGMLALLRAAAVMRWVADVG